MTVRWQVRNLSQGYLPTTAGDFYVPPGGIYAQFERLVIMNTETSLAAGALIWEVYVDVPGTGYGVANMYFTGYLASQRSVIVPINGLIFQSPTKIGIRSNTANKLIAVGTIQERAVV